MLQWLREAFSEEQYQYKEEEIRQAIEQAKERIRRIYANLDRKDT